MFTKSTVILILAAAVVNWLTRVSPYFLVKVTKLPEKVVAFLSYLPICIMFAMILSSLFNTDVGQIPQLKWIEAVTILPTYLVLKKTDNIVWTVLISVACVAILRFFSS